MAVLDAVRRARPQELAPALRGERLRVLVVSHSHPRLTRGGAEISAGALHASLAAAPGVDSWFFGCANTAGSLRLGANITQPFGADDYLYTPGAPFDHFKFANRDAQFPRAFADVLAELRPDIVHAHHYTVLGVELFSIIRRVLPACRIVLTLHEYLAICHAHGQMVKTRGHRLCRQASPTACAACFPDMAPRDFFLRQLYVQKFLGDVDVFVSPSAFLAERYVAWGLPAARMRVVDNMPPREVSVAGRASAAPRPARSRRVGDELHVGFFGQMSPLKGMDVLIEAAGLLDGAGMDKLVIDIHGDHSNQPPQFQSRVAEALAVAGANVAYHGPYDNADVMELMAGVDAVLVPSIWWENAPVVIEEALLARRPVICSDIGGMAEKVRPGLDGWHFTAGSARSLARVLQDIAARPELLDEMVHTLRRPCTANQALRAHLDIYASLRAGVAGVAAV